MFRNMPFILLAIIISIVLLGNWIPLSIQSYLYAASLTIKSLIALVLPFVIFGLLFKTTVQFAEKASKLVLLILGLICCSNFVSTMFSYSVGVFAYQFDLSMSFPDESTNLLPAWNFVFPKLLGNDHGMFAGLILGALLGRLTPSFAKQTATKLEQAITVILKGILFVIPLFITGFVVKMNYDQVMSYILRNYSFVFILIASAVLSYIVFLYLCANKFNIRKTVESIKNMLPAAIAGFGSMSSAAAMPLTLLGAEKNAQNPDLARSVIPMTVNIHLIGDCFAIPIFAFAVLNTFGAAEPAFSSYLIFAAFFVLAKFSVAAVPGGGILVMLPILETYLGFNAEMLSLITALYILFDPVITCANILGNGAFAMGMDKLYNSLPEKKVHTSSSSIL